MAEATIDQKNALAHDLMDVFKRHSIKRWNGEFRCTKILAEEGITYGDADDLWLSQGPVEV